MPNFRIPLVFWISFGLLCSRVASTGCPVFKITGTVDEACGGYRGSGVVRTPPQPTTPPKTTPTTPPATVAVAGDLPCRPSTYVFNGPLLATNTGVCEDIGELCLTRRVEIRAKILGTGFYLTYGSAVEKTVMCVYLNLNDNSVNYNGQLEGKWVWAQWRMVQPSPFVKDGTYTLTIQPTKDHFIVSVDKTTLINFPHPGKYREMKHLRTVNTLCFVSGMEVTDIRVL